MKNFKFIKVSKRLFWFSLIIGIGTLLLFIVTRENFFIEFGFLFLILMFLINLYFFFFFIICGLIYEERSKECFDSAALLLINIPIALFCLIVGVNI